MAFSNQWRTARKWYRCEQSPLGRHDIHPGERYVYATIFPGEFNDKIVNVHYCAPCAELYVNVKPDPQRRRRT